jgi:hypothetical protein
MKTESSEDLRRGIIFQSLEATKATASLPKLHSYTCTDTDAEFGFLLILACQAFLSVLATRNAEFYENSESI